MIDPDKKSAAEVFLERLSRDPSRWKEAPKTGEGYVIGAARIITLLEQDRGRALTQQEINLSIEQAKTLGELDVG